MEHTSIARTPPAPVTPAPKLEVGSSTDPLEHEADCVAEELTRPLPPRPAIETAPAEPGAAGESSSGHPPATRIQRKCESCESDEKETVQRKEAGSAAPARSDAPALVHDVLRSGGGAPLDAATRADFEPRLGADLGAVRIHTGAQAAESAREINAHAYTAGADIVFAQGQYSPQTSEGRRLLAHEVAHVMQQAHGGSASRAAASVMRAADTAACGTKDVLGDHEKMFGAMEPLLLGSKKRTDAAVRTLVALFAGLGSAEAAVTIRRLNCHTDGFSRRFYQLLQPDVREQAIAALRERGGKTAPALVPPAALKAPNTAPAPSATQGSTAAPIAAGSTPAPGKKPLADDALASELVLLRTWLEESSEDPRAPGYYERVAELEAMVSEQGREKALEQATTKHAEAHESKSALPGSVSQGSAADAPRQETPEVAGFIERKTKILQGLLRIAVRAESERPSFEVHENRKEQLRILMQHVEVVRRLLERATVENPEPTVMAAGEVGLDLAGLAFDLMRIEREATARRIRVQSGTNRGLAWAWEGMRKLEADHNWATADKADVRRVLESAEAHRDISQSTAALSQIMAAGVTAAALASTVVTLPRTVVAAIDGLRRVNTWMTGLKIETATLELAGAGSAVQMRIVSTANTLVLTDAEVVALSQAGRIAAPVVALFRDLQATARPRTSGKAQGESAREPRTDPQQDPGRGKTTDPPPPVPPHPERCPVPVNMRQVAAVDKGKGILQFQYKWDSSTGGTNTADLYDCMLGEHVTYGDGTPDPYKWPSPPFTRQNDNPTTLMSKHWATLGKFADTHFGGPFVEPLTEASFTAVQYYEYRTWCANGGHWVKLPVSVNGNWYDQWEIKRQVTRQTDGTFKYTITKLDDSAELHPVTTS